MDESRFGAAAMSRRQALGLGAGASVAVALAACGGNSSSSSTPSGSPSQGPANATTAAPKKGGTLAVGALADLIWAQAPYLIGSGAFAQLAVYDTLIRYDTGDLKPTPRLAESLSFNADQSELVVTLRPNLTYHSGKVLDAAAVVASFESINAKGTPPAQIQGLATAYVDKLQAIDARTLRFSLKRPGPLVLDLLNFWVIADAENIPDIVKGGIPNGSGPFKIASFVPKQGGKLEAFRGFWNPVTLDGIDYKVYADPGALAVAVQAGDVDLTAQLNSDDVDRLSKDKSFRVVTSTKSVTNYAFGMNTKGTVTKDARIRQALYKVADRKRMVENVFLGKGEPLNSLWATNSAAYESRYQTDPFDIAGAKKLVAEAGFPSGTPNIEVMVSSIDFPNQQICQILQADAKSAGINLQISLIDRATLLDKAAKGTYDGAYTANFGFNNIHPDSLFVMNLQVRKGNFSQYYPTEFDKFQTDIAAARTDSARTDLYKQFNKQWDDAMWVFQTVGSKSQWVLGKRVAGFQQNDFFAPNLEVIGVS